MRAVALLLSLWMVLSWCEGCALFQASPAPTVEDARYGAEMQACVHAAKSVEESGRCRADVRARYADGGAR